MVAIKISMHSLALGLVLSLASITVAQPITGGVSIAEPLVARAEVLATTNANLLRREPAPAKMSPNRGGQKTGKMPEGWIEDADREEQDIGTDRGN